MTFLLSASSLTWIQTKWQLIICNFSELSSVVLESWTRAKRPSKKFQQVVGEGCRRGFGTRSWGLTRRKAHTTDERVSSHIETSLTHDCILLLLSLLFLYLEGLFMNCLLCYWKGERKCTVPETAIYLYLSPFSDNQSYTWRSKWIRVCFILPLVPLTSWFSWVRLETRALRRVEYDGFVGVSVRRANLDQILPVQCRTKKERSKVTTLIVKTRRNEIKSKEYRKKNTGGNYSQFQEEPCQ